MKNIDVREAIKKANLKHWEIAEALNISEFTMVRRFRHELPTEQKEKIFAIIKELKNN